MDIIVHTRSSTTNAPNDWEYKGTTLNMYRPNLLSPCVVLQSKFDFQRNAEANEECYCLYLAIYRMIVKLANISCQSRQIRVKHAKKTRLTNAEA